MPAIGNHLKAFADKRRSEGKNITLQSDKFMNTLNSVLTNTKLQEWLTQTMKIKPAEGEKLAFDLSTDNNRKMVAGLTYLLNNGYDGTLNPILVESGLQSQIGTTKITSSTSLLGTIKKEE